jgi:Zn-dependent protease
VSVLVHEVAHAATARLVGLPVQEIVADLWGGHTQFEDEAPDPGRSAVVAVVGPLSNGLLALVGYLALPAASDEVAGLLIGAGIYANGFVCLFILAPGLPLDGGRLVESAVWAISRRRWAGTLAAGWCGRVVAALVVLWFVGRPLLSDLRPSGTSVVWSLLIAVLLWRGASAAIAAGSVRRAAGRLDVARYVEPARALPVGSTGWPDVAAHVVGVDDHGHPVGLLRAEHARELLASPAPPPPGTPLSAVMMVLPSAVLVPAGLDGEAVRRTLSTQGAHLLVVVDPDRHVVGVADANRLARALTGRP